MNPQYASFPDGGFVLHKIVLASENGRFSAWFDASGTVLDAEQLTEPRGMAASCIYSRPVKKDGPIWRMIRTVGQRYVKQEGAK